MPRIPLPSPETMTPDQLKVYEEIVAGPRKMLIGPLRAALHRPALADRWQKLGAILRYETSLPPRLSELAILVTARRWTSQVEWHIHATAAREAGVPDTVIEAIRRAEAPEFADREEAAIYEFARELQERGEVGKALYQKVLERFEPVGVVELTALIGYYTMVAMTLNAHEIPLPADIVPPLSATSTGVALTLLAPARLTDGSQLLD